MLVFPVNRSLNVKFSLLQSLKCPCCPFLKPTTLLTPFYYLVFIQKKNLKICPINPKV